MSKDQDSTPENDELFDHDYLSNSDSEFLEELVVCYDPDVVHDFMEWRKDPRLTSLLQLAARLSDDMRDQLLFFASEGHDGFGGLDLYAVQVASRRVGLAVNVGSPFNSGKDDYALRLKQEKGRAYVMSNRATQSDVVQELVFAYNTPDNSRLADNGDYRFLELRPLENTPQYTNTVFEDHED